MTSSASPKEVASGDAVTLSITLRGNTRAGNMADVTVPQIPDCEIFPPEKHLSIDTTPNGLSCQKSYKYLIIPRQEGSVTIPSLAWTYFDPASRSYKTLKSEPIAITVTKGKTTQAPQPRYLTQEDIRLVGQDIRYIKTGITLTKQTDTPYRNLLFLVLFPLPFLIALFALLYKFQAQRFDKDSALSMRKNAARSAKKTIAQLRKKAAIPSSEFLSTLAACLEKFVTHRHGFEATGKSLDELKQELADRGAQQTTIDQLAAFFEDMDMYRFGMRTLNAESRTGLLDKAAGFVRDLERIKGSAS
jgi:hypothetical protein